MTRAYSPPAAVSAPCKALERRVLDVRGVKSNTAGRRNSPALTEYALVNYGYQNMEDFRQESSVKTWITGIALNECRNCFRSGWFQRERNTMPEKAPERVPERDFAEELAKKRR